MHYHATIGTNYSCGRDNKVRLSNFEQFFEEEILERGKNYFFNGHVEKIEEVEENHFFIAIFGSDFYTVEVFLEENEQIADTSCDCPYDWSEFCKHQAAALYALRKEVHTTHHIKKNVADDKTPDLKRILAKLKKEELINLIIDFSKDYKEIKASLLLTYVPAEDTIATSKQLIKVFMQKAKKQGFIEWDRVEDALEGAYTVLEKAQMKLHDEECYDAVLLSIAVLSAVVDMLQYCDDSSGFVGEVIDETLAIIDEGASTSALAFASDDKEKIFTAIIKEACQNRYDGWSDWRIRLLESCIYLSDDKQRRKKLEDTLNKIITADLEDSWASKYEMEQIKLLQLKIIEMHESDAELEAFLQENMQYSSFREKVIIMQLEKGKYREVLTLCNQGEEADKKYAGLVTRWKKYRLRAYEKLQDIENQRELLRELLMDNHFEYYHQLKSLYDSDVWQPILEKILDEMKQKRYLPSAYLQILIEEKLTNKMFEYCKQHPASIQELYPYLLEDYLLEVKEIFAAYIHFEAAAASNRNQYRYVCKKVQILKRACGEMVGKKIIKELIEKYPKRKALIDELGKIK